MGNHYYKNGICAIDRPAKFSRILTVESIEKIDLSALTPRTYKVVRQSIENGFCRYNSGIARTVYEKMCEVFDLPYRTFSVKGYAYYRSDNHNLITELKAVIKLANSQNKIHEYSYRPGLADDTISATIHVAPPIEAIARVFKNHDIDLGEKYREALECLKNGETLTFKL